jgi:glycerol-3-phosphate dehydrogenase
VTAVSERPYDAVIVGGGINGCGLLRDLALRGLFVALCERRDLGSGTSGHSSGMIHGGPRYLLRERDVTRASCADAGHIRALLPHLCFRIPFLMPVLRGTPRLWVEALEAYFEAYDAFQPLKDGRPHARLSADEARRVEPGLGPEVSGALTFDEWGIDGFRLCLENALCAARHGADVLTYSPVTALVRDGERVVGAVAQTSDGERRLEARVVVNLAGPWAPQVAALAGVPLRLRRGKGVHLVYPRRLSNFGVMARAVDGRWIFVEPHQNGALLGTTDTDTYGGPEELGVTADEVEYLIEGVARVLPSIREHRFVRTTVGVRPTLFAYGKPSDDLSRDHAILDHEADGAPGLLTMVGGKLAYYRAMCEELADVVCRKLGHGAPCRTREPLPGAGTVDTSALAARFRVPPPAAARLAFRHGSQAAIVLEREEPMDRGLLCPCEPVLVAEARHALRVEGARSIDDLRRRTRLSEGPCQGTWCIGRAAALLADEGMASVEQAHRAALEALRERGKGRLAALDQPGGATLASEELRRSRYFLVGDYARLPWA